MLDVLFSDGLCFAGICIKWERGSVLPCFPGRPQRGFVGPLTLQAHNCAVRTARVVFAADPGIMEMTHLSGHTMRRTAVHLFEAHRVPPSQGMCMTGHKNSEVYLSYANRPSARDLQKVADTCFGHLPNIFV